MNKKNMILLSSLLVCSLESFAQNKVEATDSILKDMDLDAVTVVASKPLVKMETDKMTYNVEQDADAKADNPWLVDTPGKRKSLALSVFHKFLVQLFLQIRRHAFAGLAVDRIRPVNIVSYSRGNNQCPSRPFAPANF